jgi:hypothetical protein
MTVVSSRCLPCFYTQDAEAAFVVVESDALDQTGDFLGRAPALWDCGSHAICSERLYLQYIGIYQPPGCFHGCDRVATDSVVFFKMLVFADHEAPSTAHISIKR